MNKPTKVDELADSTSTAVLAVAMPDVADPDKALAAEIAKQAVAKQTVAGLEFDVAAKEADERSARDVGGALAKRLSAPGAKRDPDALRICALGIAVAAHEKAIMRSALEHAVAADAAAGVEVRKARLAVALRDAQRLLAPKAAAYHAHADAGGQFVRTAKEVIAATEAQMNAAAVAEGLRVELLGIPDTRPYQFPHELEIRRAMSCLPVDWIREAANGGFPVGDVNFHELAERTVARAAA